jgi:hypothetical protein
MLSYRLLYYIVVHSRRLMDISSTDCAEYDHMKGLACCVDWIWGSELRRCVTR